MATAKQLPCHITIGDKYEPAMQIKTQEEADAYFEVLVAHSMLFGKNRADAEALERQNLGYFAGYYDSETRRYVEALFRCAHPFFGSIETNGQPTSETAYNIGAAIGKAMARRRP